MFQRPRLERQQQADRVDELRLARAQRRQRFGDALLLTARLREIERRRDAIGEAALDELYVVFGDAQIVFGDRELRLRPPQRDVTLRELGQRHQRDAAPILDRGEHGRVPRLDGAANLAEEIELPGGVQALL